MGRRRKDPLRPLTEQERQALMQIARSGSAQTDVAALAREVLTVAAGRSDGEAATAAGRRSYEAVSELLTRFSQEGLAALRPHRGGGRKPRCDAVARDRILTEARRALDPPEGLPPLRLLPVWNNLKGRLPPSRVERLFAHGVMPLYAPLSGSWLNMAESVQRMLRRRALDGQHPQTPEPVITALEAAAAAWNQEPASFERGGRRHARRLRSRQRRHMLGAQGAHLCASKGVGRPSWRIAYAGRIAKWPARRKRRDANPGWRKP